MVALYTVFYNWIKVHKSLRVTPAMEAGLATQVCTFEDLAMLVEAHAPKPGSLHKNAFWLAFYVTISPDDQNATGGNTSLN
jgi:hypothetical protein